MTFKTTHATGDKILAADINSIAEGVLDNSHNILQLFMENIFSTKITPFNGLFFDGFSDETKKDILTNTKIDTANKLLTFGFGNVSAFDFIRASSQFGSITDAAQTGLDLAAALTFEMWVNPSSTIGDGDVWGIASKGDTGAVAFTFTYNGGGGTPNLTLFVNGTGGLDTLTINTTLTVGVWTHIAVSWDGSTKTAKFYINAVQTGGDQVGSNTTSLQNNTKDFRVNTAQDAGNKGDWKMDDVRIWDDVRTPTEITNNRLIELVGSEAGLVAYYKATDFTDETSNNNDLTNNGSTGFELNDVAPIEDTETSGDYESIVSAFQQSMATVRLWVVRNFTAGSDRFNLDSAIAQAATTLTVLGDQTAAYKSGDTIDIYTSDFITRERKTLTIDSTFGGGVTTLTFTTGIDNSSGFGTSAFVERVNLLPQISLVDSGDAKSFQAMTFERSEVGTGSTGNGIDTDEVEDEYSFFTGTPQEDMKVKLTLTRNDTSIPVTVKRLGAVAVT